MKPSRENTVSGGSASRTEISREPALLTETAFQRMVALERKRSERAAKPCLLMLLDPGDAPFSQRKRQVLEKIVAALPAFTRETDVVGWHRRDSMLGVIFTDINAEGMDHILKMMLTRLKQILRPGLGHEETNRINVSFELFPERRGHVVSYDTKMGPDFELSVGEERRGTRSAS